MGYAIHSQEDDVYSRGLLIIKIALLIITGYTVLSSSSLVMIASIRVVLPDPQGP
jgi:hypothetical protein